MLQQQVLHFETDQFDTSHTVDEVAVVPSFSFPVPTLQNDFIHAKKSVDMPLHGHCARLTGTLPADNIAYHHKSNKELPGSTFFNWSAITPEHDLTVFSSETIPSSHPSRLHHVHHSDLLVNCCLKTSNRKLHRFKQERSCTNTLQSSLLLIQPQHNRQPPRPLSLTHRIFPSQPSSPPSSPLPLALTHLPD